MTLSKLENNNDLSETVCHILDKHQQLLENIGHCILAKPELAFNEIFAHDLLTETLEKLGFQVHRNYVLNTGFRAEFSSGIGPAVAIICEYDALPDIGHACGHNLIAESGVAAGLAVKYVLENGLGIYGKIVVLGTPAEEGGGGKICMLKSGTFDDIDVVLMAHPDIVNRTYPLILAISRVDVTYIAKDKEANSLDAAVICYNQIALLRQRLSPKCRVMGIIRKSEVDGLNIPKKTVLCFHIRAPSNGELTALKKKVEACFVSAAYGTSCKVHYQYDSEQGYQCLVANSTLTKIYKEYAEGFGVVFEDDNALPVAVSSDIGNVSHIVPSIHPIYAIGKGHVNHSRGFTSLAGSQEAQFATLVAAKSLAMTCLRVLSSPRILAEIRRDFKSELEKDKLGLATELTENRLKHEKNEVQ